MLGELQLLELDAVGVDVSEVVMRLLCEPACGATAEDLRQPSGAAASYHATSRRGLRTHHTDRHPHKTALAPYDVLSGSDSAVMRYFTGVKRGHLGSYR